MSDFADLIRGVLEDLKLHGSYAEKWGVRLDVVVPAGATLAYTDFLLSTAALKSVGETCAAMTPCMRLYAFLGRSLVEEEGQDQANPYAEWIATYSDPEFDALVATLERLLDRYASDAPGTRSAYRRAMELEIAFFEVNYEAEIRSSGHE
jgi:thiaminase/transcriptional activator TenA